MTKHSLRIPLKQGGRLVFHDHEYTVHNIVGFGGSCIVYYAEREPNEHERNIGMPTVPAIIKEFYPLELTDSIIRKPNDELTVQTAACEMFDSLKNRFENGVATQTAFSINDGNHSLPLPALVPLNGTAYTVVVLTNGQTLAECATDLSMLEKADVITSLCNAIKKLHESNKLYLDLRKCLKINLTSYSLVRQII